MARLKCVLLLKKFEHLICVKDVLTQNESQVECSSKARSHSDKSDEKQWKKPKIMEKKRADLHTLDWSGLRKRVSALSDDWPQNQI